LTRGPYMSVSKRGLAGGVGKKCPRLRSRSAFQLPNILALLHTRITTSCILGVRSRGVSCKNIPTLADTILRLQRIRPKRQTATIRQLPVISAKKVIRRDFTLG